MGGTPVFSTVFDATKERPQKRTVPQTARRARAREGECEAVPARMVMPDVIRMPLPRQQLPDVERAYTPLACPGIMCGV